MIELYAKIASRDVGPSAASPAAAVAAYQPDFARQAEHLCRLGAETGDLAAALDVDPPTIDAWRAAHPLFAQAIARGRAHADSVITAALFKRVSGFELPVVKWLREDGKMVAKTYSRHIPPDTKACMYWLENRRPDLWGRRRTPASPAPHRHDASSDVDDARLPSHATGVPQPRPVSDAPGAREGDARRQLPVPSAPDAGDAIDASSGGEGHDARREPPVPNAPNPPEAVDASSGGDDARLKPPVSGAPNAGHAIDASSGGDARRQPAVAASRQQHKWKRKQKRADARRRRAAVDRVATAPCPPPLALIGAAPPAGRYAPSPPPA